MKRCYTPLHMALLGLLLLHSASGHAIDVDEFEDVSVEHIEPDPMLTLRDVLRSTIERDPRRTLSAQYNAQGEAIAAQASRLYAGRPALTLRHQNDSLASNLGLREWEANVEIPLWRPRQQTAIRKQAQLTSRYSETHSRTLELTVAGMVRDVLWDLVMAEERVKLAHQAWETTKQLERDVGIRVRAGDMARSDLLLAQDEVMTKQDEYNAVHMEMVHVIERYETLTGLTTRPTQFVESLSSRQGITPDHPRLIDIQQQIERSRSQTERLRQSRGEQIQLLANLRDERGSTTAPDQKSIGIGVRIPLDTGTFQTADLATSEMHTSELSAEAMRLQRELTLSAHEAIHQLQSVRRALELIREQNKIAQESHRLAQIGFKAGDLDLVQYLRVQARALAAERQLSLRRLQEQYAIANYNQSVGEVP